MYVEKLETDFSLEILESDNDLPDFVKKQVKPGEMIIKAESLTPEFLPEKWLKVLAEDSKNQRVLYRHNDPENPIDRGIPYGRILTAEMNEMGNMESYYRIFSGPQGSPYRDLQNYIKKKYEIGDPIGISKGFIVNRNKKDGDIFRVFALEDSITYKPKCKTCLTNEVFQMEDTTKVLEKEIKELQDKLDGAKLQLETRNVSFKKLEDKVNEYESLLETKDSEKVSLEDQIIDLATQVKKFEEKFDFLNKKPYLEKVMGLEKELNLYQDDIFKFEEQREVPWLEDRITKLEAMKSGPQVQTKTITEEKKDLEDDEEGKPSVPFSSAFRNNPELMKEIATMKSENEKYGLEEGWY